MTVRAFASCFQNKKTERGDKSLIGEFTRVSLHKKEEWGRLIMRFRKQMTHYDCTKLERAAQTTGMKFDNIKNSKRNGSGLTIMIGFHEKRLFIKFEVSRKIVSIQ